MSRAFPKFVVVTPARNEALHLRQSIASITAQTVLPSVWVIVDDGSTDRTGEIAQEAADKHAWIKVCTRLNRGFRDLGAGVVEAICDGLRQVNPAEYDFIFNIDADIVLGSRYCETILNKFNEDSRLGIAVGEVYDLVNGKLVKMRAQPLGMVGALKCWRRACFEQIGGLPRGEGWDGIDCVQAMRFGWLTATLPDEELKVVHLRPGRTSVGTIFYGWLRHGRALHFAGSHPVYVLASALYHMAERPFILGGICLILGYFEAVLKRSERFGDQEFRRYLRHWQLERLAEILKLR